MVPEQDYLRFVGGFRRYTDRDRRVSWAEPVEWPTTPASKISSHIVTEKDWMRFTSLASALSTAHHNL